MAHKLDIFETLAAIDRRDMNFFDNLTEDQRKGFAAPVILRWASAVRDGAASEHHIWLVNERANVNFWDLWEHPELQYKMMASCGYGRGQRHEWIPMVGKKKKADEVLIYLAKYWPDANDYEIEIILNQFTDESFEDFVLSSGCSPEQAKEVIAAYGRLTGKVSKGKKAGGKRKS